ncbi:tetratricopeptide repeat protein [Micromonospora sp. D93]|uniref:ATP-binding protein n=1 Tax=Micromonospora sp. D93 TaxID=2824886 RepID=UPI001B370142|nr:XRE family transcriptional regulator [Micromonospora sp. D93]MBQ1017966.1 tetratricopeptide repeat protein [Micromonospora sp. D93]
MAEAERRELGRRLAALRTGAGLQQKDVGAVIGRSVAWVSTIESGKWRRTIGLEVIDPWVTLCLSGRPQVIQDATRTEIMELHRALEKIAEIEPAKHEPPPVNQLRRDLPTFTGRVDELARVREAVERARAKGTVIAVHAVDGKPGVGKTVFVNHVARRLMNRFPGSQLFIDLHGYTRDHPPLSPFDALGELLHAVGVAAKLIPASLDGRATLWRQRMADQRTLLVLDNAVDADQIRPLLPGAPQSLVLVTSRRRLIELDATTIALDVLSPEDAASLFRKVVQRDLPAGSPVDEVVRLCGHLPMAIALAGAKMRNRRSLTVEELADRLRKKRRRLSVLKVRHLDVAAVFSLSYETLDAPQQRFIRILGLHPGIDVDGYAAAALTGDDLDVTISRLESLLDDNLVDEYVFGRFELHDLIRDFLYDLRQDDAERDGAAALDRLFDYYQDVATAADRQLAGAPLPPAEGPFYAGAKPAVADRRQAIAWFTTDRPNVISCLDVLSEQPTRLVRLTAALSRHLRRTGPWDLAVRLQRRALASARKLNDRAAAEQAALELATAHRNHGDYPDALAALAALPDIPGVLLERGTVQLLTGDYSSSIESHTTALEQSEAAGEPLETAAALTGLGTLRYMLDEYDEAVRLLTQARDHYERLNDDVGLAQTLKNLGNTLYFLDRYPEAIEALACAVQLADELDLPLLRAQATTKLGSVLRLKGDYAEALERLDAARELSRRLADRSLVAENLIDTGATYRALERYEEAEEAFTQSVALYEEIGEDLGKACVLKEYADLLVASGRPEEARHLLAEARSTYESLPDRLGLAAVDNSVGRLELVAGNPAASAAACRSALALAHEIGNPLEEAEAHLCLAYALRAAGSPIEARVAAQHAQLILTRIGAAGIDRVEALLAR